ncbi:BTAD domain-containing putative transcriptional regulator [Candidatus Mycobacterium wuenschmannii]|uniref:BTAD domain-containing putative transcriptional regulator n=1 Tax=Candidatus Mycobacterium wuenschmannii TaxID=3027808 RepID=A0ABY8VUC7_9MYCO|nr:BTAD domain-containing putative transcriptional regulator [Candidatus Mycobacterium wuenschmannii]WIM87223.1 BTAD domain-containing putative transcriptional regulator [Candidatus Mycobacterium wuenschmannii]
MADRSNADSPFAAAQFGVLGPLQVLVGAKSVPLGTPKQRAVLAMLIVNANRPVSIDSLISAAWDQRPPEGARATLHAYISNLRRLMSDAGIDRSVLLSTPPGYQLTISDDNYDFGRFIAAKNAGVQAAAAAQFEQASGHLLEALGQWRGPVLEDLSDFQFAETLAAALDEERVLVHIARAEAEIACGRPHTVIPELEGLTARHGYREPLWAQLITAYYLADRQSDALDAYLRLKSLLAEDLGIDPGWTIRELYERILRQEPLDARKIAQSHAEDTIVAQSDNAIGARRSAKAVLVAADGRRYPLAGTATRIGRSPDNDLVLSGAKVSRHHAVIADDGRTILITDLGSANGVRVRGTRIDPSAELHHGDAIRIGDEEFTLEAGVDPALR